MKQLRLYAGIFLIMPLSLTACTKEETKANQATVTGKITDANDHPLNAVKTSIEHTVWLDNYVFAVTDDNGMYKANLPSEPAGTWTAKAQLERTAYGKTYKFDLEPSSTEPFDKNNKVVRNFTWKLTGKRSGSEKFYGAHIDLYTFGTTISLQDVNLILTPLEPTLIDGSPAQTLEKTVADISGTFMATDIPVGRYSVKAVYQNKTLSIDNRHDDGQPALSKEVVFGKSGYLGETEYNIEFWVTE